MRANSKAIFHSVVLALAFILVHVLWFLRISNVSYYYHDEICSPICHFLIRLLKYLGFLNEETSYFLGLILFLLWAHLIFFFFKENFLKLRYKNETFWYLDQKLVVDWNSSKGTQIRDKLLIEYIIKVLVYNHQILWYGLETFYKIILIYLQILIYSSNHLLHHEVLSTNYLRIVL